jgi:hypothetical protein
MEKEEYLSNLRKEDRAIAGRLYDSLIDIGYTVQPVGSVLEGDQNYEDIDFLVTGHNKVHKKISLRSNLNNRFQKEFEVSASREARDMILRTYNPVSDEFDSVFEPQDAPDWANNLDWATENLTVVRRVYEQPEFHKNFVEIVMRKSLEALLGLEDSEIKNAQYNDGSMQDYAMTKIDERLKFEVGDTKFDISINSS